MTSRLCRTSLGQLLINSPLIPLQHTKHALEALHPNIKVFRHPDHVPRGNEILSGLLEGFQNLRTADLAKVSGDTLKALYGGSDDMVLFWAHHEKLCLVDGRIAFMGGLDMCKSRDKLYRDVANWLRLWTIRHQQYVPWLIHTSCS